mmetsp:Transcript_41684/g.120774  ORF Transcript_41684/g.120774 Transcript_41684/m.120774 type:complete len:268 (-) Transcript_41684:26-829(-)
MPSRAGSCSSGFSLATPGQRRCTSSQKSPSSRAVAVSTTARNSSSQDSSFRRWCARRLASPSHMSTQASSSWGAFESGSRTTSAAPSSRNFFVSCCRDFGSMRSSFAGGTRMTIMGMDILRDTISSTRSWASVFEGTLVMMQTALLSFGTVIKPWPSQLWITWTERLLRAPREENTTVPSELSSESLSSEPLSSLWISSEIGKALDDNVDVLTGDVGARGGGHGSPWRALASFCSGYAGSASLLAQAALPGWSSISGAGPELPISVL